MPNKNFIDAYARSYLKDQTDKHKLFLYAAHFKDANHLQLGFGCESTSGLNLGHIPGPQIHEFHITDFVDWCHRGKIELEEGSASLVKHPFSSAFSVDLPVRLQSTPKMTLAAGRYFPLLRSFGRIDAPAFGKIVNEIREQVWGHEADWEVETVDLHDGRLLWYTYDSAIQKIRTGIGYYDAANQPVYGSPCFAIGKLDAEQWVAWHYLYLDMPLEFFGRPAGWPVGMSMIVAGRPKQAYMACFLRLADKIWG